MRSNNQAVNANGQTTFSLKVLSASEKFISSIHSTLPSPAQCSKQSKVEYSDLICWTACCMLSPEVKSKLIY